MPESVINVQNISKSYRLGEINTGTLSHDLNAWVSTRLGRSVVDQETVIALQDISFDVKKGEVLGVIGKNGAGKSTLLKIISRITAPTTGNIKYKGKVASLLEVGTGMHPEMTARENIFLNGAILGMNKQQIRSRFDEIIEFSGCGRFVDTPIKRFSSGMKVRLGFAVAAYLEADILIVDEVLAVGDSGFQNKCMNKIDSISKEAGRTIIFVSHNMASIQRICSRCILLDHGEMILDDSPERAIAAYFQNHEVHMKSVVFTKEQSNRKICILPVFNRIAICDKDDVETGYTRTGESLRIKLNMDRQVSLTEISIGIGIDNSAGERLFSVSSLMLTGALMNLDSSNREFVFNLQQVNLMPGRYSITISAVKSQNEWLDSIERAIDFEVIPTDVYGTGRLPEKQQGIIYMPAQLSVGAD